jgi:two-component sensor histidine kinase
VVLSKPDKQGQITFTWTETGGPPVVPPSRQGYGTRFITSTLQGLFGGKVSVDYRPEGLCLSVSGPAATLFSAEDNLDPSMP